MSNIQLLNCDCMEYMKDCKDKQFDLAIVDVPYGIDSGNQSITMYMNASKKWPNPKMKQYKNGDWDKNYPSENYFIELIRVSKNQIIWGANHFISKIPFDSSAWIVWDKLNGESHQADCELAYTSFDCAVRKFEFLWNGFQKGESTDRIHPTQKPVKLYKWILKNYAKEGDKIFDSHGGSMSIAIACHDMNFDLTLCEIDKDYYEAGKKRYENHIKQIKLFQ